MMRWAVDIDPEALHIYSLNDPRWPRNSDLEKTHYVLGSVNDYLKKSIAGESKIAKPGEVDFILAGSPCIGWSSLSSNKASDKSQRACSLIASALSFIDFYRPKYALLENVPGMAKQPKNHKGNVFSQVISCLVALGYQTNQFNLDAWSFGNPQCLPGGTHFASSELTGCSSISLVHFDRSTRATDDPFSSSESRRGPAPPGSLNRCLGYASNGMPFGERMIDFAAPFRHVTIGEATADLPLNWDGRETHIRFPDHVPSINISLEARLAISCISRYPDGSRHHSIGTARRAGLISPQLKTVVSHLWQGKYRSQPGRFSVLDAQLARRGFPHGNSKMRTP